MTEENKIDGVNVGGNAVADRECFCQSVWFKKFLTKTLAVFVGVYAALSLFAAMHKPPMPPCPYGFGMMKRPTMHCHHHYRHHKSMKGEFYKRDFKNFEKQRFEGKRSIESQPASEK